MSRLHKAVVVFPKPEETKPNPEPDDSAQVSRYLEHLLDLADEFFRHNPEKKDSEFFRHNQEKKDKDEAA